MVAVYPTSIYRQCDALTLATPDASTIEAVMSTTLTTTIKIARDVLQPSNRLLYNVYKPLGRCVAVVDDKVDENHGKQLEEYFAHHGIEFIKLVFSGNEVDKDIRDVERSLVALKKTGQGRQEPVLVVGGGVIADIAGFATALYSRNTPYVMLCTSIVSGIDAGPSPRVCCNGFDYKNLYGAYHPPVLTITDRGFWKNLHPGWLRHGVAEIIKMAVMKDIKLFELMEKWGKKCNETKFGTEGESVNDPEFQDVCDLIIGKAMEGYVKSEYGNLWETHQCRPHAYGHTWSPGYELPSGMLHGQAVGTCMGFGAYLAEKEGMIDNVEMTRVLKVISDCELCLWHPVMENSDAVWRSQVAMIEKRGGNLCAPVPMPLGESGYINELSEDMLKQRLQEYKEICMDYPRQGAGVDMHCVDVGLEDPQAKKVVAKAEDRFVVTPSDLVSVKLGDAIEKKDFRTVAEAVKIVDSVDGMVTKYSSQPSSDLKNITLEQVHNLLAKIRGEFQGNGSNSQTTTTAADGDTPGGENDNEVMECAVCFECPTSEELRILRRCSHCFCHKCLDKITGMSASGSGHSNCPLCRQPFKPSEIFSIKELKEEQEKAKAEEAAAVAAGPSTSGAANNKSLKGKGKAEEGPRYPVKVEALLQSLQANLADNPQEKFVVFSQFTHFLDIIKAALKKEFPQMELMTLDGRMNANKRRVSMELFKEATGNSAVILISLKAGGVGINLTCACKVYLMDLWWNPAVEDQAMDRVHRIGQTRAVTVTRYVVDKSIEKRICSLQETKKIFGKGAMQKLSSAELRQARLRLLENLFEDEEEEQPPPQAPQPTVVE
jgi:3-dehydroquinate synthase